MTQFMCRNTVCWICLGLSVTLFWGVCCFGGHTMWHEGPTRDWTHAPSVKVWNLNCWSAREVPQWLFSSCAVLSRSVMSDCLRPHGLYVTHQAPLSMGILQARILEWVAMSSSRGSPQPRDRTPVSHIAGGFLTVWITREALLLLLLLLSRFSHVWPHRRQPTRLLCPWDSPGKNTGGGCHSLLQCMKVKSESEVAQSCPTLSDPMDCSLPGSSVHGIFQARVLEWGAIAFSEGNPRVY